MTFAEMSERGPSADRPRGGYWDLSLPPGLSWAWAETRLAQARNYWITSTRRDERPYSRPVWGVWLDNSLVFDSKSLDANLSRDPRAEAHLESGDEVIILEGVAGRVEDPDLLRRLVEAYNSKYEWNWGPGNEPPWPWQLRPRAAFGWTLEHFASSATRWTFPDVS